MEKIMSPNVTTFSDDAPDNIAARLREARESKGLSRAKLANRVGIPAKSLEKFEYGTMEPSLSRLKVLCDELGVTPQWVMGEDQPLDMSEMSEEDPSAMSPSPPANDNGLVPSDPMSSAVAALGKIDGYRSQGYAGSIRSALASTDQLRNVLIFLEPDALVRLASQRGVDVSDCPAPETIIEMFHDDQAEALKSCHDIEDRIIDTAVLGIDLHTIERRALVKLADDLEEQFEDVEKSGPFGFGWGDYERFVPVIRPALHLLALSGKGIDFDDWERFPLNDGIPV